jgi:hypothetical protein
VSGGLAVRVIDLEGIAISLRIAGGFAASFFNGLKLYSALKVYNGAEFAQH